MQILQYQSKSAHPNTVEKYVIYKEFSINNHLNGESNIAPNKIFDALLKFPTDINNTPAPTNNPNQLRDGQ